MIRHKLTKQSGILKVQSIDGEVDLGLGSWSTFFDWGPRAGTAATVLSVCISLARHRRLLDLAVHRMAPQSRIVFLLLNLLGLKLFVPGRGVARGRLPFFPGLRTLNSHNFTCHKSLFFFLSRLFFHFIIVICLGRSRRIVDRSETPQFAGS